MDEEPSKRTQQHIRVVSENGRHKEDHQFTIFVNQIIVRRERRFERKEE
jgi:hypothetical protein